MAGFSKKVISLWTSVLENDVGDWELAELDDPVALEYAFSGELRFGTGGIRALMGVGPNRMNRLTIGRAAQGLADWLNRKPGDKSVAVGYDTRIHSREFAMLTARVLASNGVRTLVFETPQPTPVLDFAVRELRCTAGVVITASHNPREYNGFKVYGADGVQATNEMAREIELRIEKVDPFEDVAPMGMAEARASGLLSSIEDSVLDRYHDAVIGQRLGSDCSGLRVVYSPLNGTGLAQAERAMEALGVQHSLVPSQSAPDGNFPDCPRPNPEDAGAMARGMAQLVDEGADLFLATDPDADRLGVACVHGGSPRLLTGNEVGLLLLDHLARRSRQKGGAAPVAVTTIVTAPLADAVCEANGVELRRTLTGFKYVGEQMCLLEAEGREFLLGLEESDGYLRGSYVRDKDGVCALVLACEVAAHHKRSGRDLVEALEILHSRYGHMPGRQIAFAFSGEGGRAAMAGLMASLRADVPTTIGGSAVIGTVDYLPGAPMPVLCGESGQELPPSDVLEWRLEGGSRVLVRPSGTEPKLKCYVFARASTEVGADSLLEGLCEGVSGLIHSRKDRSEGAQ